MPETPYADQTLTCVDCHQPWTFEAGEQEFFADKGLSTPKRCKPCRQKKREEKGREGGKRRD